ncbi:MAG: formylglycine-generating enzyme family protein, partial [Bacteroidales bacterium]
MKKLILFSTFLVFIVSCGKYKGGELVGVKGRKDWQEPQPYGMVFVPMGSFTMGPSDEDASWANTTKSKTVSVDAFWMDETEITNNEYRQFVEYVKDSI